MNDQIEQSHAAQQSAQVYLSKAKKKLKRLIATKSNILNDALETFSVVTGDVKLENKMNDSFSDLFRATNLAFIPKIKEVIEAAETHIDVLQAEYVVSSKQIDDLKADLDNFLEWNASTRISTMATWSPGRWWIIRDFSGYLNVLGDYNPFQASEIPKGQPAYKSNQK